MILKALCNRWVMSCGRIALTATCLFFHTRGISQVTYKGKAVSMGKVIDALRKQTSYKFVIDPGILERAGPVTFHLRNASIGQAMEACLKGQPLRYELDDGTVYIKLKGKAPALPVPMIITDTSVLLTVRQLDETVVTGYGPITQRQNTGDITIVDANIIGVQPVSNPLAALEGRVPGLVITQINGMPGAGFVVRVRGENSIANGR